MEFLMTTLDREHHTHLSAKVLHNNIFAIQIKHQARSNYANHVRTIRFKMHQTECTLHPGTYSRRNRISMIKTTSSEWETLKHFI